MSGSGCGATMVPDDLRHAAYLGILAYSYRVADLRIRSSAARSSVGGWSSWSSWPFLRHGCPAVVARAKTLAHSNPSKQRSTDVSCLFCCC